MLKKQQKIERLIIHKVLQSGFKGEYLGWEGGHNKTNGIVKG
jgi:hypothetical protein